MKTFGAEIPDQAAKLKNMVIKEKLKTKRWQLRLAPLIQEQKVK